MEWKMSDMMEHKEKDTAQRISDPFSWDGHRGTGRRLEDGSSAEERTDTSRGKSENNWNIAEYVW